MADSTDDPNPLDYRSATRPPRRRAPSTPRAPALPAAERVVLRDGRVLQLRPIHASDAPALQRAFLRLTPDQIRARFFYRITELGEALAARLCNPDVETTAAFVVTDADGGEIRGEARLLVDATTAGAEFGIAVDPSFTGRGVGRALMRKLIDEARRRGLVELWGEVLTENALMLDLASRLGAQREAVAGEPGLMRVRFDLTRLPPEPPEPDA
ncbi:MAG TPA: GNAT family N-acetyltransferase [Dokdonella sp.]